MTRKNAFTLAADLLETYISEETEQSVLEIVATLRKEVEKLDREAEHRRANPAPSRKKERDEYYDLILDILSSGEELTSAQIVERLNDPEMTVAKIIGRMNKLVAEGDVVSDSTVAKDGGRKRLVNVYRKA